MGLIIQFIKDAAYSLVLLVLRIVLTLSRAKLHVVLVDRKPIITPPTPLVTAMVYLRPSRVRSQAAGAFLATIRKEAQITALPIKYLMTVCLIILESVLQLVLVKVGLEHRLEYALVLRQSQMCVDLNVRRTS